MRRTAFAVLLMTLMMSKAGFAADTEVHGRMYVHWMLDKTVGADNANEFALGRTYVTVKSKLNDYLNLRVTSDLRQMEVDGKQLYDVIIKYGYLDWKPDVAHGILKVRFGLQPTLYIDYQNKLWGRRYLSKTISDLNKYLTSSDLGASLQVGLGEKGRAGVVSATVYNGTSYSGLGEENKHKDFNGVLFFTPLHKNSDFKRTALLGQFYYGVQNVAVGAEADTTVDTTVVPVDTTVAMYAAAGSDYKRQIVSIGGLFAYRHTFDLGVDLNFVTLGTGPRPTDAERKKSGLSFHGTLYFGDLAQAGSFLGTMNLFGRVDINDPNTDVNNDKNTYLIAGLECVPVKGFKATVNYRRRSFDQKALEDEKQLFVNTLFKF